MLFIYYSPCTGIGFHYPADSDEAGNFLRDTRSDLHPSAHLVIVYTN